MQIIHRQTVRAGLLLLAFTVCRTFSYGQQKAAAPQSAVQSPCANDTIDAPNATTVNIKCSGLTPEQQKLLRNIPDLLNKLLATQKANNYELLSKMDACIDDAAIARRTAAAAVRGITTIYSFDGAYIRTVDHSNGGDKTNLYGAGVPLPEFIKIKQLEAAHQWQELVDYCEPIIKAKPEWLTPYLFQAEAYLNLYQTDQAVPILKFVRNESGGSPEYADAARWLTRLGY